MVEGVRSNIQHELTLTRLDLRMESGPSQRSKPHMQLFCSRSRRMTRSSLRKTFFFEVRVSRDQYLHGRQGDTADSPDLRILQVSTDSVNLIRTRSGVLKNRFDSDQGSCCFIAILFLFRHVRRISESYYHCSAHARLLQRCTSFQ